MSDKIRGALFNTLGDISGMSLLDAFSGTGAVAIEAVSRDAQSVLAIERDPSAFRCIKENIATLAIDNIKAIHISAKSWSHAHESQLYDVVVCDPPFNDTQAATIEQLARHVAVTGLLVVSWPTKVELPRLDSWRLMREKLYGDARLLFYKQ
jgi:16S rRNA (guanine966-N2)-methyltransferase